VNLQYYATKIERRGETKRKLTRGKIVEYSCTAALQLPSFLPSYLSLPLSLLLKLFLYLCNSPTLSLSVKPMFFREFCCCKALQFD
jgi:hypothetical protein